MIRTEPRETHETFLESVRNISEERQYLSPIGEELKAIVSERRVYDDFKTRVANRQKFFDKARELLQSADTITIDYEKYFTPEFEELLAENPEEDFSSLSEIEKISLSLEYKFFSREKLFSCMRPYFLRFYD